jgi:N-acetyl-anhydromuramyl-L-alanine amidase AmpD
MSRDIRYLVCHRYEVEPEAYHYTVARDGTVVARNPESQKDRSCRNFNSVAISIAMQGCFLNSPRIKYHDPTPEQWEAAVALLARLSREYPDAKISGHTELGAGATYVVSKLNPEFSCPGPRWDMDKFRRDVRGAMLSVE